MKKDAKKEIKLPEFIRLSHYRITLELIPSEISEECAEQQGSFHSRTMRIYLDKDIVNTGGSIAVDLVKHELFHAIFYVRQLDGQNEENIVNGMATHYTEIEKNNPDYVIWKLNNLN